MFSPKFYLVMLTIIFNGHSAEHLRKKELYLLLLPPFLFLFHSFYSYKYLLFLSPYSFLSVFLSQNTITLKGNSEKRERERRIEREREREEKKKIKIKVCQKR
uniref:Uncharacterized protein n=1 Tax=Cacopsylla melanoneura TaxID=428564 RepID=A0A8D8QTT2_9HEMI